MTGLQGIPIFSINYTCNSIYTGASALSCNTDTRGSEYAPL